MNESEIKKLWKQYDTKLEHVLSTNQWMLKEITKQKAKKRLAGAKPIKYLGIILGIPWILFLNVLIVIGYLAGNAFFALSFGIISSFTMIALGTYIYHLLLINQVDISDSILEAQHKLAKIKTSTISMTRIVVLQFPFWTTWYLRSDFLTGGNEFYWIVNSVVTGVFVLATIWLFQNIRVENLDKKWMKWIFSDAEWNSVIGATNILNQMEDFKNPKASD